MPARGKMAVASVVQRKLSAKLGGQCNSQRDEAATVHFNGQRDRAATVHFNGQRDRAATVLFNYDQRRSEASDEDNIAEPVFRSTFQRSVYSAYNNPGTQTAIALLIVVNFVTTIANMQIDPHEMFYETTFRDIFATLNFIFLVELLANMYAHGLMFYHNPWNWFDALCVLVGFLYLFGSHQHYASVLRIVRALRVFRLFKRVTPMRGMLLALLRAVPGVTYAFAVLTIVMSVYALIAVSFFAPCPESISNRSDCPTYSLDYDGMEYPADEYWGTFFQALFSLFQVQASSHALTSLPA